MFLFPAINDPMGAALAKAYDHQIIFIIKNFVDFPVQGLHLRLSKVKPENGILQPVASALQFFVNLPPAFGVPNVITNEIPVFFRPHQRNLKSANSPG